MQDTRLYSAASSDPLINTSLAAAPTSTGKTSSTTLTEPVNWWGRNDRKRHDSPIDSVMVAIVTVLMRLQSRFALVMMVWAWTNAFMMMIWRARWRLQAIMMMARMLTRNTRALRRRGVTTVLSIRILWPLRAGISIICVTGDLRHLLGNLDKDPLEMWHNIVEWYAPWFFHRGMCTVLSPSPSPSSDSEDPVPLQIILSLSSPSVLSADLSSAAFTFFAVVTDWSVINAMSSVLRRMMDLRYLSVVFFQSISKNTAYVVVFLPVILFSFLFSLTAPLVCRAAWTASMVIAPSFQSMSAHFTCQG